MTTRGSKKLTSFSANEIERLRALIADYDKSATSNQVDTSEEEEYPVPRLDDYIPVMSLLPHTLNLTTKEGGQGSVKKFTKFGEVKKILYRDLVDIFEVHPTFLQAGYFYILDPAVIRHHGLDEIYSKILTKEKIEEILSTNSEECVNLYNSANEYQQEIILGLLIDKVRDNPQSVNLNIVDRLSRVSKVDISKRAEDARALHSLAEPEQKE